MYGVWRRVTTPILLCRNIKQASLRTSRLHHVVCKNFNITSTSMLGNLPCTSSHSFIRFKSKKQAARDSDDEDEFDDDSSLSRDSKVVKFSTTSMRTDVILKSALGVSRNKIEQVFYESKIRLNGKKIMKKSVSARIGDEIDVIKAVSVKNPDHLHVSRVEIINVTAKEDNIMVTARRFKTLLIENYEIDPYKASAPADAEN